MKIKKVVFAEQNAEMVWDELNDNCMPDFDETNRLQLDEVSLTFSLLSGMHSQIQNGGVMQFLDNGSGGYFHETIDALERVGYSEFAAILQEIKSHFPNRTIPKDMQERRDIIDMLNGIYPVLPQMPLREKPEGLKEWDLSWEEFDDKYYNNQQVFYKKVLDYLHTHATLID